ncbi:MAG: M56 family metallopeptidase [Clostridia bacterium]|nr:M56 family metallopeptidase [Clostridia bacterium]
MSGFFLSVVNMSISASWIVLAVLLLRLLIKKAPKWITVLLWGIVAIRLICPFSIESVMSLIPSAETISPEIMMENTPAINSGVPIINNTINPIIGESFAPDPSASANPLQIVVPVLSIIWITGIAIMLAYTVISYLRVKNKIGTAVLLRDNIFQSENVVSPFVLGIIKPRIYLPFNMKEQDMEHVISHENAHIRRKDHLWKPFGFLVLTLHWFNPLIWLGYTLLCRDIELACDEKVIKELDNEQKADYSQALLSCSVNRRIIAACPIAFGEVGVKNRVKSVLNYKKPAFWIIILAIIASVAVAVCFLTNPRTTLNDELSVFIDMQVAEHNYSEGHTDGNFVVTHHKILDVDETLNKTTVYMWSMYHEYSCKNGKIQLEAGSHIPTVITAKRTGAHGHYELVEYWTPGDGSDYANDIKAKFPWHLHSKALDPQRYVDQQIAFCEKAAKEYFSDSSNDHSTPKLTWTYQPMLSFTGYSFKAFSFDFDYTYVEASCTGGEFCSLDVDGQPYGTKMRFEN